MGLLKKLACLGANLRALDFDRRDFSENFAWSVFGGVQITDWLGARLELYFPAIDFGVWLRFSFLRLSWLSLDAVPGVAVSTGALDDRGAGVAACVGLMAEFRVWEGLVLFVFPAAGIDALRATWVVPFSLGVGYYL